MTGVRFWVGGSPCAGKSSVAARLAVRHGLRHVECDAGAAARRARMAAVPALADLVTTDTCERLARPPRWQADREIRFYHEQFPFLLDELRDAGDAVVEGADLLPDLLHAAGVPAARAVWLVPTPAFQWRHYAARPWVRPYLAGCPDPERAFAHWMRRDELFARHVRDRARALGATVIEVDGSRAPADTADLVERHLGLVLS